MMIIGKLPKGAQNWKPLGNLYISSGKPLDLSEKDQNPKLIVIADAEVDNNDKKA